MKFIALLALAFFTYIRFAPAQEVLHDPNIAFAAATRTGKDILLIFSGSDWCIPCIRFEKKILSDSSFQKFAGERLVILVADFPQRKRVPDSLRIQYEALAEQFDPSGQFPQIILLDSGRKRVADVAYTDQPPGDFIRDLRSLLL
ncbi:MAG TPA: thioredoxin family protein [Puia sp.]|jgi:thioredoxin-related protein|nr:thioredoxin family protein [Puia sp.]